MDEQAEQARRARREAAKSRLRHALLNLSNAMKGRHDATSSDVTRKSAAESATPSRSAAARSFT
ncbi:MAG: hypothetical protein J0J12_14460 [Bosea sp.]|nr:hypothetical protein [Bosea sp. (in: a-proteobacteria)]